MTGLKKDLIPIRKKAVVSRTSLLYWKNEHAIHVINIRFIMF